MRWSCSCVALLLSLGCGDADTSTIEGSTLGESAPLSPGEASSSGAPGKDGTAGAADPSRGESCAEAPAQAESCGANATSSSNQGAEPPGSAPDDTGGSASGGMGDPSAGAAGSGGDTSGGAAGSGDGGASPGSDPPPEALPDLIVDGTYLMATVQEDVVDASADMCLFAEGCVNGPGLRRVVRFGTRSANVGAADVVVGRPEAGNPSWEFDACHEHFHFEGYASYQLLTSAGERLPIGNKNGFCLRDLDNWTGSASCGRYDCEYQGIGVGCADVYTPDLDCQWIDITDVAAGTYELVVTVNTESVIREADTSNNSASVSIEILPNAVRVIP